MTRDDYIKLLQQQPEDLQIVNCWWSNRDVLTMAEDMGLEVSEEEAGQVIDSLEDNFDAEYGVNWDTIRAQIKETLRS